MNLPKTINFSFRTKKKYIFFTVPEDIKIDDEDHFKKMQLLLFNSSYRYDIFKYIPRKFTISTRNGSSNFNKEMIMDVSQTIFQECEKNPEFNHFNLDIVDEEKVLEKFSQLFQGQQVSFSDESLVVSYKIIRILNINNCPNFMKPYELQNLNELKNKKQETGNEVIIDFTKFFDFLSEKFKQTFTIFTRKNEYKCNLYAVYSSKVIREFLNSNPETTNYKYDFDDEYQEFENIHKIFNFEKVTITRDNIDILNKIIEELEITSLYENMNNYQSNFDKIDEEIEEEEKIIQEMNYLLHLFYDINESNKEKISTEIYKYCLNKSDDEIRELSSFIIEFIKTENDYEKQNELVEILIKLDEQNKERSNFKLLLPTIIKQILFILGINKSVCSFAYILYKKNQITKDELFNSIKQNYNIKKSEYYNFFVPYKYEQKRETNSINDWFLQELNEIKQENNSKFSFSGENHFPIGRIARFGSKFGVKQQIGVKNNIWINEYLRSFLPDKLDIYKKIRNSGQPEDELTRSIRSDDVDTLQRILTNQKMEKTETLNIPYNIFEDYIINGSTSYINYSAAYGSIKCFKYLILNHHQIDDLTFKYSIYGGNIEIIKIVDQKQPEKNNFKELIMLTIIKHRDDLFDWLFEQKFAADIEKSDKKLLNSLMKCSVKNGNSYAIIKIVDKGFDLSSAFSKMINYAASNGFYTIVQLIHKLVSKKHQMILYTTFNINSEIKFLPCVSNGNCSILNFYIEYLNQSAIEEIYIYAIINEYMNIIEFIENLPKEKFEFSNKLILHCLQKTFDHKSSNIFDHLVSKCVNSSIDLNELIKILIKICILKKIENAKKIIQIILALDQKKDLSPVLITSLSLNLTDISRFLIDSKAVINYEKVLANFDKISSANEESFSMFMNSIPYVMKQLFVNTRLYEAIKNKNIHLIKYLFDQKAKSEYALIEAVKTDDIEIVDLVLEYFNPAFINQKTIEGTALSIATENINLDIVKRLLSIPGIDPSIRNYYYSDNYTALNIATRNQSVEIFEAIFDFYGENIQSETSQLNESTKIILGLKQGCKDHSIEKGKILLKRILTIENIDYNCFNNENTILSFACSINDLDLVKYLLNTNKVDVNLSDPKEGNTALIKSIKSKNYEIAKLLIEYSMTDINISNCRSETALTAAVENETEEIVKCLIQSPKFDSTRSRLDYAFYISTPKICKLLISCPNLDVNYVHKDKFTQRESDFPFHSKLINENNSEIIDLIIHHPSFDKVKSLAKYALFKSIYNIEIFKKLLAVFDNDINIIDENGDTLLVKAVRTKNKKMLQFILNHPNFDCNKNEILYAYDMSSNSSSNSFYGFKSHVLTIHQELLEYIKAHSKSIDFNRLMPNGKPPPKI